MQGRSFRLQRHNRRFQLAVFAHRQQANRDGQTEPSGPARARIEIEHALLLVKFGHMRVTGETGCKLARSRVQVQRASGRGACKCNGPQPAQHRSPAARRMGLHDPRFREWRLRARSSRAHAESKSCPRRPDGECGPRRQRGRNLRPQQAMCIADDAKFHRYSGTLFPDL